MQSQKVTARVELEDYPNRVLTIVKAKFGLKDKSEALNKFISIYGDEILEKEGTDEYVKKLKKISENHFKKYGNRKMSEKQLNALFED